MLVFAALHESGSGTSRKCRLPRVTAAYMFRTDSGRASTGVSMSSWPSRRTHDIGRPGNPGAADCSGDLYASRVGRWLRIGSRGPMAAAAQIAANRRNGLKSTGPRTAGGKAVSCRNAQRHGMTARPWWCWTRTPRSSCGCGRSCGLHWRPRMPARSCSPRRWCRRLGGCGARGGRRRSSSTAPGVWTRCSRNLASC